jgi:hypothetical protein
VGHEFERGAEGGVMSPSSRRWTGFEPGPASSPWIERPCPAIDDTGLYTDSAAHARPIRIFTGIDTRLMFEDLYAKLTLYNETFGDTDDNAPLRT